MSNIRRVGLVRFMGQQIYTALFRMLGPAQLGDPDEAPPPPLPPAAPCPRCRRPLTKHTYVETSGRKGLLCAVD